MTIKQQGGIFGRNPTFNDVTAEGTTSLDGPVVINESGADADFRVESDTQENALFVDGTNGHVGVGIANPPYNFVVSNDGAEGLEIGPGYAGNRTLFQNYNRATSQYVASWEYASEYVWNIGGTEKMRLNTSGNLAMASGNGIDFSATSGTGTSELFDDYEEGSWTPQYTNTTPPTTPYTMDIVSADYVKIGNTVFITANIRTDSVNTSGALGALRISGLPFTCGSSLGIVSVSGAVNWGGDFPSSGYVNPSSTQIILRYRSSANGATLESNAADLTSGATANQNTLQFSAIYTV